MKSHGYGGGRSFEDKLYCKSGLRLPKTRYEGPMTFYWPGSMSRRSVWSYLSGWIGDLISRISRGSLFENEKAALAKEKLKYTMVKRSDDNAASIGIRRKTF